MLEAIAKGLENALAISQFQRFGASRRRNSARAKELTINPPQLAALAGGATVRRRERRFAASKHRGLALDQCPEFHILIYNAA
jgi:hypothetical protein